MNIRPEYPRPQFKRSEWLNLNGEWDFTIDNKKLGRQNGFVTAESFDKKIIVPFCPESKLSGVEHKDFMNCVWYTRTVLIDDSWLENGRRTFINIGASDFITTVYVNGEEVGSHRGGYISFSFEITAALKSGENRITICAEDDAKDRAIPSGKQSDKKESYGCYYTRTTGIWQTVWLENTPSHLIKHVKLTPSVTDGAVRVEVKTDSAEGKLLKTEVSFEGKCCGTDERSVAWDNTDFSIKLTEQHLWDIENPNLYDVKFTLGDDTVQSYFGLREIALRDGKTYLNGKCVFQRLILDQGFYPDGIYTAPSDEELKNDILRAQDMGYNGARLHEKIFEERFLYHADRLGYIVWGEYPNWGIDISGENGYVNIAPEWLEELERDYNHPSIIGWCPLNETQYDRNEDFVRYIHMLTKTYDPTRLFIGNSGWRHVKGTYDMFDVHDYLGDSQKFREKYQPLINGEEAEYMIFDNEAKPLNLKSNEITFVSEFGGARWVVGESDGNNWGYGEQVKDTAEFIERYTGLVDALLDNPKISAFCYTQLTDIEQEQNGLYTYGRKAKFDPSVIKEITSRKAAIEK